MVASDGNNPQNPNQPGNTQGETQAQEPANDDVVKAPDSSGSDGTILGQPLRQSGERPAAEQPAPAPQPEVAPAPQPAAEPQPAPAPQPASAPQPEVAPQPAPPQDQVVWQQPGAQAFPQTPPAAQDGQGGFGDQVQDFESMADLPPDRETKIGRGSMAGKLFVILILILAGIFAAFYYYNEKARQEWEDKIDAAFDLPEEQQPAALRDIFQKATREDIREIAARELGWLKDAESVPLLISAIKDTELVSRSAAMSLARINNDAARAAVDRIEKVMNEAKDLAKVEFAWSLCMLGDSRGFGPLLEGEAKGLTKNIEGYDKELIARVGTTDKLLELSDSNDQLLRMYAAMELGRRKDKDVIPALTKLVKDSNDHVSKQAAISLGRTGDERAGPVLMDILDSKPEMLDTVLGAIRTSVGFPGLKAIGANTKDLALKKRIVGMMRQLRDPRAADYLLEVYNNTPEGAQELKEQALWALEELGDVRIADAMIGLTKWEKDEENPLKNRRAEKLADGAVEWLGIVRPEGAKQALVDLLEYHNSVEPADWTTRPATIMRSLGMYRDPSLGPMLEKYLYANDRRDFAAAAEAVGRSGYAGAVKTFVSIVKRKKDEKFSTLMEARDWQMEDRLQDRRNSIFGLSYLGNPDAAEALMNVIEDVEDDPELRLEAANALANCADEEVAQVILSKIADEKLDMQTRTFYVMGLWHYHSSSVSEAMLGLLEGEGNDDLVPAAAVALGEAADPAYAQRVTQLLSHSDEKRRRGAMIAVLLGAGDTEHLEQFIKNLSDRETALIVRDRYERHPVFLTRDFFESGRFYRRLETVMALTDLSVESEQMVWPYKHLTERLKKGYEGPNGLSALEIRKLMYETAKSGDEDKARLAAMVLSAIDEKGYLLALASEEGAVGDMTQKIIRASAD